MFAGALQGHLLKKVFLLLQGVLLMKQVFNLYNISNVQKSVLTYASDRNVPIEQYQLREVYFEYLKRRIRIKLL